MEYMFKGYMKIIQVILETKYLCFKVRVILQWVGLEFDLQHLYGPLNLPGMIPESGISPETSQG